MTLKKIESLEKANHKEREWRKLQRKSRRLAQDIRRLVNEHDSYQAGVTEQDVYDWLDSFPVNTLSDSLKYERGILEPRLSLADLNKKTQLRKLVSTKQDELAVVKHKEKEAKIDILLEEIGALEFKLQ